jgi:hypothetical protein
MVVCFAGSRETKGQNGLKAILLLIEFKKVRIILIVPTLWV